MSRKGAGLVKCTASRSYIEIMTSVGFLATEEQINSITETLVFYRYSDRYLETIAMKLKV